MKRLGAHALKRQIGTWLASPRVAPQVSFSVAESVRRARQLLVQIRRGSVNAKNYSVEEDAKPVLYALVALVVDSNSSWRETKRDLALVTQFLNRVRWKAAIFDEKQELLRELHRFSDVGKGRENLRAHIRSKDPFARRPATPRLLTLDEGYRSENWFGSQEAAASDNSSSILHGIFDRNVDPRTLVAALDLETVVFLNDVLDALRSASSEIARDPVRVLLFSEELLKRLKRIPTATVLSREGSSLVVLMAEALRVAGSGRLWTADYGKARLHIQAAYKWTVRARGDDRALARVELAEAQRRVFIGRGAAGLALARRARKTFEEFGAEVDAARARTAEGMALLAVGRAAEAIEAYRSAIATFERNAVWGNYAGAVNSSATSLTALGRVGEARRQYARALSSLGHHGRSVWVAYVQGGLGELLFSESRYREAAQSLVKAAATFAREGLVSHSLKNSLFAVESWIRAGEEDRAREELESLLTEFSQQRSIDAGVTSQLRKVMRRTPINPIRVSDLRRRLVKRLSKVQPDKSAV